MKNNDYLFLIKKTWNRKAYQDFLGYLESLRNEKLVQFNQKIIPTKQTILGIRTPILRQIARYIAKGNIEDFLKQCQSHYFEETLIEGFVIGHIQNRKLFEFYFDSFIQKIDNWATCDMCVSSFSIMKKEDFYGVAKKLIEKEEEFIVRVGIIMMLDYYLDSDHTKEVLQILSRIRSKYYYVNMAISWLISVAFVKERNDTLELIQSKNLPVFVQNKAIQKIRESFRVSSQDKNLLLAYKK